MRLVELLAAARLFTGRMSFVAPSQQLAGFHLHFSNKQFWCNVLWAGSPSGHNPAETHWTLPFLHTTRLLKRKERHSFCASGTIK